MKKAIILSAFVLIVLLAGSVLQVSAISRSPDNVPVIFFLTHVKSPNVPPGNVVFNPREYTIDRQSPWEEHHTQGLDNPQLQVFLPMQTVNEWTGNLNQDAGVLFGALLYGGDNMSEEGRLLIAGALSYLLKDDDIIPDHLGNIGTADDALILRISSRLAIDEGLGISDRNITANMEGLSSSVGFIDQYPKPSKNGLYEFVNELPGKKVNGYTAEEILKNDRLLNEFYSQLRERGIYPVR